MAEGGRQLDSTPLPADSYGFGPDTGTAAGDHSASATARWTTAHCLIRRARSPQSRIGQSEPVARSGNQLEFELVAGNFDQPGEVHRPGFIRADQLTA